MPKKTEEFINDIKNGVAYNENLDKFTTPTEQTKMLSELIETSNTSRKDLVKVLTPTDNNGYKYLNGGRAMKRDILIKICITCNQDIKCTANYLKRFGFLELYPRNKRDYIIMQGIEQALDVEKVSNLLSAAGEKRL